MQSTRRTFMMTVAATGATLCAGGGDGHHEGTAGRLHEFSLGAGVKAHACCLAERAWVNAPARQRQTQRGSGAWG